MSAADAHAYLSTNSIATSVVIEDTDSSYDCFDIAEIPALEQMAKKRNPDIKYVHLEYLESEGQRVFNLMFFSTNKEHIDGAELTKTKLFWDDEDVIET
jgi:hypothetical protein